MLKDQLFDDYDDEDGDCPDPLRLIVTGCTPCHVPHNMPTMCDDICDHDRIGDLTIPVR